MKANSRGLFGTKPKKISILLTTLILGIIALSGVITALATPAQNWDPTQQRINEVASFVIEPGAAAPHYGDQIGVYGPPWPGFPPVCPLPAPTTGTKWVLRADTDGDGDVTDAGSAPVTYYLPAGGSIRIEDFGDGGTVTITLTGGATISPSGAGETYAWAESTTTGTTPVAGTTGTDTLYIKGYWAGASCGIEDEAEAEFLGTATLEVIGDSVGGYSIPVDKIKILMPYLTLLVSLVLVVALVTLWKKRRY